MTKRNANRAKKCSILETNGGTREREKRDGARNDSKKRSKNHTE